MTDDLTRNRQLMRAGIAPVAAVFTVALAAGLGLPWPGGALAQPGPDRANRRVPVRIKAQPGKRDVRVRDARKPDRAGRAQQLTRVKQQAALRATGRADREKLLRRAARRRVTVALARGRKAERGAMAQALMQEHRRSARRIARLYRIQEVAAAAGDVEAIDRTERLIALEQARHAKWMIAFEANTIRRAGAPAAGDGHGHAPGDGHGHAPGDGHGHAPGDGHGHAPAGRKGARR